MSDRDGFLDKFKAIITKKPTRHQLHLRAETTSWKSKCLACREHHELLSDREREFLDSLRDKYWRCETLTDKQGRWLNGIYYRLVFDRGIYD